MSKNNLIFAIVVFLIAAIFFPFGASAKLGVGIGPGKIGIDEPFKPGGLYKLPPITVVNTGDEKSQYGVSVEYQSGQEKMTPARKWFVFSPDNFSLEPGKSQVVEIRTNIPLKAKPGDYFAFLSAHPVTQVNTAGGATMEISAAAKMSFSVMPANIFQAAYYRTVFLWAKYAPWTYIFTLIILLAIIFTVLRRYVSLNIGFRKKEEKQPDRFDREERLEEMGVAEKSGTDKKKSGGVNRLKNELQEVETFTAALSEQQWEAIYSQAKKFEKGIRRYFYENKSGVMKNVGPELGKLLSLSKDWLDHVKIEDAANYQKILEKVISGIIK